MQKGEVMIEETQVIDETELEMLEYRKLLRKCNNPRQTHTWSKRNELRLRKLHSKYNTAQDQRTVQRLRS